MISKKKCIFKLILITTIILPFISSADIWKQHINSNIANQVLCDGDNVWVRSDGGGLTKWNIQTKEFVKYYAGNGLPSNSINKIFKSDDGKISVLIGKDIYKYENDSFVYVTSSPSIPYDITFADGKIYCGYRDKDVGIQRYDGNKWEELNLFEGYNIFKIEGDPRGGFWATASWDWDGTFWLVHYTDEEVIYYPQSEVIGIPGMDGVKAYHILRFIVDDTGILWVCIKGGIAWFDGNEWNQYYWDKENFSDSGRNLIKGNDGNIWISRGIKGLYKFDGITGTEIRDYDNVNVKWVSNDIINEGIWVGSEDSLENFDTINREEYKIENVLPISNSLETVKIDFDGNLWCGDKFGDIAILHRSEWNHFRGRDLSLNEWGNPGNLFTLHISENSGLWTGFSWDILRYDGNLWISYLDILEPEIGNCYRNIVEGSENEIWVSANNGATSGIARWKDDTWEFFQYIDVTQETDSLCFDERNNLWVVAKGGDRGGIWKFKSENWNRAYRREDFIDDDHIPQKIFPMRNGEIWGVSRLAIVVFDENGIKKYIKAEDGLKSDEYGVIFINSLKEGQNGITWIASSFGLQSYDGFHFKTYDAEDAGFRIGNDELAIDSTGRIFLNSSNNGLTEFTPSSVTLKFNLFTSGIVYEEGDNLHMSMLVSNYGPDETGDLYFVMMAPDGTLYSGLDWSQGVKPAAEGITIPEGFRMPLLDVIDTTLPLTSPPISQAGQYFFAIGLTDTGTTHFRSKTVVSFQVN